MIQRAAPLAALLGAVLPRHALAQAEPDVVPLDFSGPQTVKLLILLGVCLVLVFGMRTVRLPEVLRHVAVWSTAFLALVAAYTYRGPIEAMGREIATTLVPGVVMQRGEDVVVRRAFHGQFVVGGSVEGAPIDFLFDTGASMVVLSADDGQRAGYGAGDLDYRIPVMTASGMTRVAPVQLAEVGVGAITLRRVRAAIARPGDLDQSLLGMTFLNRLSGYEVRRDRLILYP